MLFQEQQNYPLCLNQLWFGKSDFAVARFLQYAIRVLQNLGMFQTSSKCYDRAVLLWSSLEGSVAKILPVKAII